MNNNWKMRTFAVLLKRNGYFLLRIKGGHYTYKHKTTGNIITINCHPNPMIIRRLIKENNLI